MAQILTSVCDKHWVDGEQVAPTQQVPIDLDGESFLLDLCAEHYKAWLMPLKEELLAIANVQPEILNVQTSFVEAEPEPKPITLDGCQFCDHAPFKATVGMISHMRTAHPDEYPAWKKRWDIAKADG